VVQQETNMIYAIKLDNLHQILPARQ